MKKLVDRTIDLDKDSDGIKYGNLSDIIDFLITFRDKLPEDAILEINWNYRNDEIDSYINYRELESDLEYKQRLDAEKKNLAADERESAKKMETMIKTEKTLLAKLKAKYE